MPGKEYRTIEDRLEQIESDVHQIKFMLSEIESQSKKPVQQETKEEQFMNAREVTEFLKISSSQIYAACANNDIKFVKFGKSYRFKKGDVLEWVEKMKILSQIDVDDYVDKYMQKNVLRG